MVELFPACKDKIVFKCTGNIYNNFPGTPLSNDKYVGRYSTYGMANTVERLFDMKYFFNFKRFNVKGLWIAGQDVAYPSILGNLTNGIVVALKVLEYI